MRHRKKCKNFDRDSSHRKSMFRNLLTSLIIHESIVTTEAKAKELRKFADNSIRLGKIGTLHARRLLAKEVFGSEPVQKTFDTLAKRFTDRTSGFTRIIKIGERKGDGAPLSLIEFLPEKEAPVKTEAQTAKAVPNVEE